MKIGLAGQGAFGVKHLEAVANIPGIEVVTLTGGNQESTAEVAKKFNIPHYTGRPGREPAAAGPGGHAAGDAHADARGAGYPDACAPAST